jgi:Kdo2-lipid IVA lauroyltransferase/acyltransferase
MKSRAPEKLELHHYLAPKFWPMWVFIGLSHLVAYLPLQLSHVLGRGLGRLFYYLLPQRKKITLTNIKLAFPQLDPMQQTQLVKRVFSSMGMMLMEMPLVWWGSEKRLQKIPVDFEGLEYFEQALASGRGVIMMGGHTFAMELGGRLLSSKYRFNITYQKMNNALMDVMVYRSRTQAYQRVLERMDMRTMIRSLKQGEGLWYAPDQDFGRRRSVFAPFFGVQTATLTSTSRLAKSTGAMVIPLFFFYQTNGRYLVRFLPPLQGFPSGDDSQDALQINQTIETQVAHYPEQYVWVHRRYKTRPPGEAAVY